LAIVPNQFRRFLAIAPNETFSYIRIANFFAEKQYLSCRKICNYCCFCAVSGIGVFASVKWGRENNRKKQESTKKSK
jgi:hypothetical protein